MKKLMVAIAGAVAMACSAFAAEPKAWFNGGIDAEFPIDESMSGGAWSNVTEQAAWDAEKGAVVVDADVATPLTFTATNAKKVTGMPQEYGEAEEVVFNATIKFTPFETLPAVPAGAKAGVVVSKDKGEGPYYYYIDNGNWMKYSEDSEPKADSAVSVSITVNGFDGKICYVIDGGEPYEVDMDEAQTFQFVNFTGDGEVSALSADYTSDIIEFTVADVAGATKVVNVNGEDVEAPYYGRGNDNLVVTYTAAQGKLFKNGTNKYVYKGKVGEGGAIDTDVENQGLKDAPAKIGTKLYYTLNAAFEEVCDGQTLTLLTAVDESIVYEGIETFTLDMNGQAWTVTGDATALKVDNEDADITITGNGSITVAKGFCVWTRQGAVTIENGTFTNDDNDNYAIYAGGGVAPNFLASKVTIKGGTFVNLNGQPYVWQGQLHNLNLNVQNNNATAIIEVSGGTYTAEPKDDTGVNFVKDGYVAKKDGEIWTVGEGKAKIGTTYYLTLKEAFDAVADDQTITLWSDSTSATTLTSTNKNVTLDLNGFTYTATSDDYLMSVTGGDLTIKDSTVDGNGMLDKTGVATVIQVKEGAKLVFESGTLRFSGNNEGTSSAGSVIAVKANSSCTMNGGKVIVNNKYQQVALRSDNTFVVNGGYVDGGFKVNNPGTISLKGGEYTEDPTAYVASGYAATKVGDTWMIAAAMPKATVAENPIAAAYGALDAAYTFAVDGVCPAKPVADKNVDYVVTFDNDVEAGAIRLAAVMESGWTNFPAMKFTKNTPYPLIASMKKTVSVAEMYAMGSFTCGISNISVAAETKMTVSLVMADTVPYVITNVTYTITPKVQPAPTPAPGSDVKIDPVPGAANTYVVTPTGESKDVVIENVADGATLIVNGGSVDSLVVDNKTGVNVVVSNRTDTVDVTKAVVGWGLQLATSGLQFKTASAGYTWSNAIAVRPVIDSFSFGSSGEAVVGVTNTVNGLFYTLMRREELDYNPTAVTEDEMATGDTMTQTDDEPLDGKAFYEVKGAL